MATTVSGPSPDPPGGLRCLYWEWAQRKRGRWDAVYERALTTSRAKARCPRTGDEGGSTQMCGACPNRQLRLDFSSSSDLDEA